MDYCREQKHFQLRKRIEYFCEEEISPIASEIDQYQRFPLKTFFKLSKEGFMGLLIPSQYGGKGDDIYSYAIVLSILARFCGSTAQSYGVHTIISYACINRWGNEQQKYRLLPGMARGEKIGALAITEPEYGSDVMAIKTIADDKTNHYILNGEKAYIVNAPFAGFILVIASLKTLKGTKCKGAFIIEAPTQGLSTQLKETMGFRGSGIADVLIENCIVPKTNLLGEEQDGFAVMMSAIEFDRIGVALITSGIAEAAFDASIKYSKNRFQFGKPISNFEAIQFKLADMATNLFLAKAFIEKILDKLNAGKQCKLEIAMAKVFSSEMATKTSLDAIQIHGAYGYTRLGKVERLLRDAKGHCIGGGTTEMNKLIIAREFLR